MCDFVEDVPPRSDCLPCKSVAALLRALATFTCCSLPSTLVQDELAQLREQLAEQQQARDAAAAEAQIAANEAAQLRQHVEEDAHRLEQLTAQVDAAQAARCDAWRLAAGHGVPSSLAED